MSYTHAHFLDKIWDEGVWAAPYGDWLIENGMPLFGELILWHSAWKEPDDNKKRNRVIELTSGEKRADLLKEIGIEVDPNHRGSSLRIDFDERGFPFLDINPQNFTLIQIRNNERDEATQTALNEAIRIIQENPDLFRNLKIRNLKLSDEQIDCIKQLTELRELDLYNVPLTEEQYVSLATNFSYDSTKPNTQTLTKLSNFFLRHGHLAGDEPLSNGVLSICRLPNIKSLMFDDEELSEPLLRAITIAARNLKQLTLNDCPVQSFLPLRNLTELEELELNISSPPGEVYQSLTVISELKKLKSLDISTYGAGAVNTEFIVNAARGLKLEKIVIGYAETNQADIEALVESQPGLKYINIYSTNPGEINYSAIGRLKNLKQLRLYDSGLTSTTFLRSLKGLEYLDLEDNRAVNDRSIKHITAIGSSLNFLSLEGTNVTEKGLRELCRQKDLDPYLVVLDKDSNRRTIKEMRELFKIDIDAKPKKSGGKQDDTSLPPNPEKRWSPDDIRPSSLNPDYVRKKSGRQRGEPKLSI